MNRTLLNPTVLFAVCTLLLAPLVLVAAEPPNFTFDAPPGPQFSEAEKQTQRDKGAGVVPLARKAFEAGAESVTIPPGDYRFGKERWGRDGVIYPLEFFDLLRNDDHPFTIDATGATFWFDLPHELAKARQQLGGTTPTTNLSLPPYYPRTPAMLDDWAATLDAVRITDRYVGEIVERLRTEGLLEQTVVFFISDHGVSQGRTPESESRYDSDMAAYLGPKGNAEIEKNIKLMKQWAREGK